MLKTIYVLIGIDKDEDLKFRSLCHLKTIIININAISEYEKINITRSDCFSLVYYKHFEEFVDFIEGRLNLVEKFDYKNNKSNKREKYLKNIIKLTMISGNVYYLPNNQINL